MSFLGYDSPRQESKGCLFHFFYTLRDSQVLFNLYTFHVGSYMQLFIYFRIHPLQLSSTDTL